MIIAKTKLLRTDYKFKSHKVANQWHFYIEQLYEYNHCFQFIKLLNISFQIFITYIKCLPLKIITYISFSNLKNT